MKSERQYSQIPTVFLIDHLLHRGNWNTVFLHTLTKGLGMLNVLCSIYLFVEIVVVMDTSHPEMNHEMVIDKYKEKKEKEQRKGQREEEQEQEQEEQEQEQPKALV